MRRFDDDTYYRPGDEQMRLIATAGCLAQWRHHGTGPPFTKFGRRILYRGCDLNRWMDEHRVEPRVPRTQRARSDGTRKSLDAESRWPE